MAIALTSLVVAACGAPAADLVSSYAHTPDPNALISFFDTQNYPCGAFGKDKFWTSDRSASGSTGHLTRFANGEGFYEWSSVPPSHVAIEEGEVYQEYDGSALRGRSTSSRLTLLSVQSNGYDVSKVKWTDQNVRIDTKINKWAPKSAKSAGPVLYSRYRGSGTYYLARLRKDGRAEIQKSVDGIQSTLAIRRLCDVPEFASYYKSADHGCTLKTNRWYHLRLSTVGNTLDFYLDGVPVMETPVEDDDIAWGASGMGSVDADLWIDNWAMAKPPFSVFSGDGSGCEESDERRYTPLARPTSYDTWRSEDFETARLGARNRDGNQKQEIPDLLVTAGSITVREKEGNQVGHIAEDVFRAVLNPVVRSGADEAKVARWSDLTFSYAAYVNAWTPKARDYQGLSIFARYRTEDDLYVGVLRRTGEIKIQRKRGDKHDPRPNKAAYHVLRSAKNSESFVCLLGTTASGCKTLPARAWYMLEMSVNGNRIRFTAKALPDGPERTITVTDEAFGWGTVGIRSDFVDLDIDDMSLENPSF